MIEKQIKSFIYFIKKRLFYKSYFDLQIFAADDDRRTEDPTEHRLQEARKKGQVPKSQLLVQSLVLVVTFFTIFLFSKWILKNFENDFRAFFKIANEFHLTLENWQSLIVKIVINIAMLSLPFMIIAFIFTIVSFVIQFGFLFTTYPLKFDITKLKFDPATMFKKLFFSKDVAMNLFKTFFQVIIIGILLYIIIKDSYSGLINTLNLDIRKSFSYIALLSFKLVMWASILLLVLSIPDYIFQKRQHINSLKMSPEELKREMKEFYGDPQVKQRLKDAQMRLAEQNMIAEIPKSDVVITNPTHLAVVLKYDPDIDIAGPRCTAKGMDSKAELIKRIARENNIEIMENKPLARDLYKRVNVGEYIPEDLYEIIAELYAYLYRLKEKKAV